MQTVKERKEKGGKKKVEDKGWEENGGEEGREGRRGGKKRGREKGENGVEGGKKRKERGMRNFQQKLRFIGISVIF